MYSKKNVPMIKEQASSRPMTMRRKRRELVRRTN